MALVPHPTNDVADRISGLQRSAPDIEVWVPMRSESGQWEARGQGFEIIEGDPAVFADKLCRRLGPASTA